MHKCIPYESPLHISISLPLLAGIFLAKRRSYVIMN